MTILLKSYDKAEEINVETGESIEKLSTTDKIFPVNVGEKKNRYMFRLRNTLQGDHIKFISHYKYIYYISVSVKEFEMGALSRDAMESWITVLNQKLLELSRKDSTNKRNANIYVIDEIGKCGIYNTLEINGKSINLR